MGAKDKGIPYGLVAEDQGNLYIEVGQSDKASDFIVDVLEHWWEHWPSATRQALPQIQLKVDNGPKSSGVRPQFLNRFVAWVDHLGKPLQLLYFPPYHSKSSGLSTFKLWVSVGWVEVTKPNDDNGSVGLR